MDRTRKRRDAPTPELVRDALQANRVYADELRAVLESLQAEEAALSARVQALRRKMALRRAERAMDTLLPSRATSATTLAGEAVFEREVESAYKKVGVVPRSFIRPKRSFFHDDEVARAAPTKKPRKSKSLLFVPALTPATSSNEAALRSQVDYARLAEPPPNADTVFLRAKSHEAFVATPSRVFSAKERQLVRQFAEGNASESVMHHRPLSPLDSTGAAAIGPPQPIRLPLKVWSGIAYQRPPIHRSAFSCKLWWELHEDPSLRLSAWTKQEDEALKRLASGQVDPTLVNNWEQIARRMPILGRPPVHCLIRYQTKLCASNVNSTFTPEEDALIQQAVSVFGEKWNIVADLMDGRVPEQIRHRWQLSLAPGIRQGKFSILEDRRLLLAIAAYHERFSLFQKEAVPWHDVAHHIPGRTLPALRDRFLNSLNPELTFAKWTAKEDAVIKKRFKELGGLDYPGIWSQIASELGNRSDNQVSRRWKLLAPLEYERIKREKKEKMTLTAVFRRPTMPRRHPKSKAMHQRRTTYNAMDSDGGDQTEEEKQKEGTDSDQVDDDSSDSSSTQLQLSAEDPDVTDDEPWVEECSSAVL
jgi:hypothetical protein